MRRYVRQAAFERPNRGDDVADPQMGTFVKCPICRRKFMRGCHITSSPRLLKCAPSLRINDPFFKRSRCIGPNEGRE